MLELDYLNCWPEGTIGYEKEKWLIHFLYCLCQQYGYGRVKGLISDIAESFDYPDMAKEKWKKFRKNRLAQLAKYAIDETGDVGYTWDR